MNFTTIISEIKTYLADYDSYVSFQKLPVIIIVVLIILTAFNLFHFFLGNFLKNKISEGPRQTLKRVVRYSGYILAFFYVLKALGINITPILGAAGVAGIVIGFAAQTVVSSIISGFFLISEKAFSVGDVVKVGDVTGVVLSVDVLSVKLRTMDNLYMRIPNENIIRNNITTITHFPIRRFDVNFSVAYKEDLEKVKSVLFRIASENRYCLESPEPLFVIDKFADSGINILFAVWFESGNFTNGRNSISIDIKKSFEEQGIEIPYKKIDIAVSGDLRYPSIIEE
jgi:small-conductance mechanosensitive channel